MSEEQHDISALSREWAAARIVIIVGFVLAAGAGGYYAWEARQSVTAQRQELLAGIKAEQAQQNAQEASDAAGEQLCKTALGNAQNFGIIPPYGQLTAYEPKKSDVKGRYVCAAATSESKYLIAADLVCNNLKNTQCVSLFSITEAGGTVLYQRHG
jgi:predicted negative regulator of RcsB-dependent stress response